MPLLRHRSRGAAATGALLLSAGLACAPQRSASTEDHGTTTTGGGTSGATTAALDSDAATATSTGGTTGASTGAVAPCSADQCVDDLCIFEACACALVPEGVAYLDCGEIHLYEPTELWHAAHDCVLAAVAQQQSFKVVFARPGLDSQLGSAFVGLTEGGYSLRAMHYDSWGPDVAEEMSCESIAAIPDCVLTPQQICLECVNPGEPRVMCGWNF